MPDILLRGIVEVVWDTRFIADEQLHFGLKSKLMIFRYFFLSTENVLRPGGKI